MRENRAVRLVGIAGPSCAGKGTLCQWLAGRLGAGVLPIDSYYRPLDHLSPEARAAVNFDDPAALEDGLLVDHLRRLARGEPVYRPVYDFATHSRNGQQIFVASENFILVEGLFTLYWPEVRTLLFVSLFVDAPAEVCLSRHIARDRAERGRTVESVQAQYKTTVLPMRARYIDPTKANADLVLDGVKPVEEIGPEALAFIKQRC
jgi:uridine kinase